MIRARDGIYGFKVVDTLKTLNIEQVVTAPRSPGKNGYFERVIGHNHMEMNMAVEVATEPMHENHVVNHVGSRLHHPACSARWADVAAFATEGNEEVVVTVCVIDSGEPVRQDAAPHETHQFRNTGDEPFVFICAVPKAYE